MSDLNLYQRRIKAREQVFSCAFKKVQGKELKYPYLPIDQIKPVVEKAWIENGIVMDITDCTFGEVTPARQVPSGYEGKSVWWVHNFIKMTITLVNADDSSDTAEITVFGEAKDNSDKCFNKCFTSALKNFYKMEFNIVERNDDTDSLQDDTAIAESNGEPAGRTKVAESAKNDPFFGKPATPAPESKPAEEPSRSEEQTRHLVEKWGHLDFESECILGNYRARYGEDVSKWGTGPLGECYADLLAHNKQRNARQEATA